MISYGLVMIGGAIGAAGRYAIARLVGPPSDAGWPLATLAANLIGALAMGLLIGWLTRRADGEAWKLLLGVGVLGGFTTFSTFSLELVLLIGGGRTLTAISYALLSTLGSIVLLAGGLWLARPA